MIINTNMASLNTIRQLTNNEKATRSSLARLSSGLRINSAADDAAGLAISEKMRGQISGLNKASSNAQDGISLASTAEGALNETTSILQRMRELAVQAGNDTNTTTDRAAMQTEVNQLTSEVNRIGNTTEFNTQKLLQGDGKVNLVGTKIVTDGTLTGGVTNYTQASQLTTITATVANTGGASMVFTLNGQQLTVNFTATGSNGAGNDDLAYGVTANSANVASSATSTTTTASGLVDAINKMINENSTLKGNYVASNVAGALTIAAVSKANGGTMYGAAGNIAAVTVTAGGSGLTTTGGAASVGTTTYTQAQKQIDFSSLTGADAAATDVNLKALVGTGMTINGQEIEFYNANDGAYTGSAIGVNISTALANPEASAGDKAAELVKNIASQIGSSISGVVVTQDGTATTLDITADNTKVAEAGNTIEVKDGGVQKSFEAKLQIGANTNQTMTIQIDDMRSQALNISGTTATGTITASNGKVATLTTALSATNGSDNKNVEYSLDISSADKATAAVSVIDDAINKVSSERANLGAYQNRLEHTINNLGTSSQNITSAEANIRDVDMAAEMTNFQKNNILQQAAQAMLAQANQQPQGVLQLLR